MKVRTASGPILWFMKACGFKGWTSFWSVVYVLPGWETVQWLIRHEAKHIEQIERDGVIAFSIKYAWWTLRYGYWGNPYEREARACEQQAFESIQ